MKLGPADPHATVRRSITESQSQSQAVLARFGPLSGQGLRGSLSDTGTELASWGGRGLV